MSFMIYTAQCNVCGKQVTTSFGLVGMTFIAQPIKYCVCGGIYNRTKYERKSDKMKRDINIGTKRYTQVTAEDEKEFNANHRYVIRVSKNYNAEQNELAVINFQKGPIKENKVNGVMHEDLIATIIDRLESFQQSEYACRENALAITKLEEALMWLRKRTNDREARGVEGTSEV